MIKQLRLLNYTFTQNTNFAFINIIYIIYIHLFEHQFSVIKFNGKTIFKFMTYINIICLFIVRITYVCLLIVYIHNINVKYSVLVCAGSSILVLYVCLLIIINCSIEHYKYWKMLSEIFWLGTYFTSDGNQIF